MQNNIEKILQNSDNLASLSDKTDALSADARQFQKKSNTVNRMMCWRNAKLNIAIAAVALLILAIIVFVIWRSIATAKSATGGSLLEAFSPYLPTRTRAAAVVPSPSSLRAAPSNQQLQ